jgi:predicted kinase
VRPEVHELAAALERAIEAGDIKHVLLMIDASRLRPADRRDVCRLLSQRRGSDVVLVFDRFDAARVLTAA